MESVIYGQLVRDRSGRRLVVIEPILRTPGQCLVWHVGQGFTDVALISQLEDGWTEDRTVEDCKRDSGSLVSWDREHGP